MSHKFLVHLDPSDQSDDSADGVNEFRPWVEIGGDHLRGLVDAQGSPLPCAKAEEARGAENSNRDSCVNFFLFMMRFVIR